MIINKHGSFYLRCGWGTKIIQAIEADDMIFSPSHEQEAVDKIGLGRVMIKALRYWSSTIGLTEEEKSQGGITEVRTHLFNLIGNNDRYFQKTGSLLLLHRNLSLNQENATAWYWAFNEMDKQSFTKEEFVDGLHYYLAVNGMNIKKMAVDKEFNCFKNTYIGEKKFDIRTAMDEDTYPLLAPLHLLRVNDEKKIEKCFLTKSEMPLLVLVYAIRHGNFVFFNSLFQFIFQVTVFRISCRCLQTGKIKCLCRCNKSNAVRTCLVSGQKVIQCDIME